MKKYFGDKSREFFKGIVHHCITNILDVTAGHIILRQNTEDDNSVIQKSQTLNGRS